MPPSCGCGTPCSNPPHDRRVRQPGGSWWWLGIGLALGLPALAGLIAPHLIPDTSALRPGSGVHQNPLNYWTCAWLHANTRHLLANLAGLALVMLLGWTWRLPARSALAWALAWPLTHLALLLDPRLDTYYGLSGVLHAGVAITAVHLITGAGTAQARSARTTQGWLLLGGLLAKCWLENPRFSATLARPDLAMTVAPLSHLAGALVGLALAWALSGRHRCSQSRP